MVAGARLADLQAALAKVELGVHHHAVELGDAQGSGAKHFFIECERVLGTGDGKERRQRRESVRHPLGGEGAIGCDCQFRALVFSHECDTTASYENKLVDSRQYAKVDSLG